MFGPSGEDRPDVLTDAETVVLPIWLHRRPASAEGTTTGNAASFLKTITVPADTVPAHTGPADADQAVDVPADADPADADQAVDVPAEADEASGTAAGAGEPPENGATPESGAAPQTEAEAAPETAAAAAPETPGAGDAEAATGPDEAGPDEAAGAKAAEAKAAEVNASSATQTGTPAEQAAEADADTAAEADDGAAANADVNADAESKAKAGTEPATGTETGTTAGTETEAQPGTDAAAGTGTGTTAGTKAAAGAGADPDAVTVVTKPTGTAAANANANDVTIVTKPTGPATTTGPATSTGQAAAKDAAARPVAAQVAGPDMPTQPGRPSASPDSEATTMLSHAELRQAIIQARTLEAIEAIEAIDALETSTLGGLEVRTAKALETVEAISALEAKTAQAIKTIEAMTADALQAIDATVAEVAPGLTGQPGTADKTAGAETAEPADAGAKTAEPETADPDPAALERAETATPADADEAASSPGTDVARTHIISIEEPPASVTLTTSATETTIAVPQPRAESLVAVAPVPATDTAPLAPVPPEVGTAEPAALPAAAPPPEPPADPAYVTTRRRTRVSRAILLCILGLQAILSLRLHNTAFEDESLYLYSGHMELEHLLHGAALQGSYASYFSGAPVLYPVAAGFLNGLGGLTAARMLSLVEMLSITALLYSMSRRLFNERIALCAALLFSVCESAIFLGNFATYDATCLFLLSLAAWIVVRTAGLRWPVFLLAAPVAALAVGVKYAGLLFVPTIAVLPAVAGWPLRGRRVVLYPPVFVAAVAGLLYGALRLGGKAYITAISSTTTQRAQGLTPVTTLLKESAEWGGVIFVLAVIGTIAYVWRARTEPEELMAPTGGRFRRLCLGLLLTGTALLAPAYQAHLHTDISFQKHIGFGLFFAAPIAGVGLARLLGDHFRRPHIAVGAWSLALVLGIVQSTHLYQVWPNSNQFVRTFSHYLQPHARYLVEVPEVPIYYLLGHKDAQPRQFTSTFYINYRNSKGVLLTGTVGFTAAVDAGYFNVVAYNNEVTGAADAVLAEALSASKDYYLAAEVYITDVYGPGDYFIWVKGHRPKQKGLFVHANPKYQNIGTKMRELAP